MEADVDPTTTQIKPAPEYVAHNVPADLNLHFWSLTLEPHSDPLTHLTEQDPVVPVECETTQTKNPHPTGDVIVEDMGDENILGPEPAPVLQRTISPSINLHTFEHCDNLTVDEKKKEIPIFHTLERFRATLGDEKGDVDPASLHKYCGINKKTNTKNSRRNRASTSLPKRNIGTKTFRYVRNIKRNKQISTNVPSLVCPAIQTPTSPEKDKVVFVPKTLAYLMMPCTWMYLNHVTYIVYLLQKKNSKMDGIGKYVKISSEIKENHWITVVCFQDEETVYVCDSAYRKYSPAEIKRICKLFRLLNNWIKIIFLKVQQQSADGNNCGFFAIVNAIALCFEIRPDLIELDEKCLRQSFSEILQEGKFTLEFAIGLKKQSLESPFDVIEVLICSKCKLPSDNARMIRCTNCDNRFHLECVSIQVPRTATDDLNEEWTCDVCISVLLLAVQFINLSI